MNGFTRTPWRLGAGFRLDFRPVVLVFGVCAFGLAGAQGATIHHRHDAHAKQDALVANPSIYRSWSEYIMAGPSVWSHVAHPQLTPAIEASMWKAIKSDPPPNTDAVVNFFLYRQSLDAKRFDHFHPNVARALAKIKSQLASLDPTTPVEAQTLTTPPATTSPAVQAQELTPSAVPEPSSVLLTIGMAGYVFWQRRRRR